MQRVIEIIIRYRKVLLLIIYITLSLIMLIRSNSYQQSIYLSSANSIVVSYNTKVSNITGYLNLKGENTELQEENTRLQLQLIDAQTNLRQLQLSPDSTVTDITNKIGEIRYMQARVISATVTNAKNYITINRGENSGIAKGMGVLNHKGIVGIVDATSQNNSIVMSILNPNFNISCKIRGGGYYGSLQWDGKDTHYAQLIEISTHATITKGDTIVTSGYSNVYPEGILVGTVDSYDYNYNQTYYTVQVKLSADLSSLTNVSVVDVQNREEINSLHEEINELQ